MKPCPNCGTPFHHSVKFCSLCGIALTLPPPDVHLMRLRTRVVTCVIVGVAVPVLWLVYVVAQELANPAPQPIDETSHSTYYPVTPEQKGCAMVYLQTYNKGVGSLTANETQLVQLCQTLGMYKSPLP